MSYHRCPKCGKEFYKKHDPPRVTCYDCWTSWYPDYEGSSSSGEGCATLITILIIIGIIIALN